MSDIDQLYLELLSAWGDQPLDEQEVKKILKEFILQEIDKSEQNLTQTLMNTIDDFKYLMYKTYENRKESRTSSVNGQS